MNTSPPPTARAYQKNARTIAKHVKVVAKDALPNAAKEIRMPSMLAKNCGISCDGTWKKREYSSQNGCVIIMAIDTGSLRVLDVEPLTKVCTHC